MRTGGAGAGRRCEPAVPGRQSPGWHSLQSATGAGGDAGAGFCQAGCSTGAADAPGAHSLQSAVGDRCGVDAGARGGRTGGRVKDALFGQICTSRSHFPRSLFLKVQICPNQCTHPVHAPHAPRPRPTRTRPRPVLRCPTVQKTGRFTSPSPISAGYSPPKTQICRFFVPSPPNSTDGAECARPPPLHRSPPRLTATAEQSASYRLSGNSTVTRHPSPSLRTLTVP